MPDFNCPACHADIEPDLIERTGKAECPFCGADLSRLGLPQPAEIAEPTETMDVEGGPPTGEQTRSLPSLPSKSRIRVVESTADRLVLVIPAGGKQAGGLGCFAAIWNGFMGLFTAAMIGGFAKGQVNGGDPPLALVGFLGLFWLVGLGFAWFWLKFRFERTFILLDRERIAVQRILFGRKKLDETALAASSRAELVESYRQNDTPVYRVEVKGSAGAAKFGTALADDEKDWIVDRINEFLGVPPEDSVAASRGNADTKSGANAPLVAPRFGEPEEPGAIPADEPSDADTRLEIVDSTPDRLTFWYAVAESSPLRRFGPPVLFGFSAIWLAGVGLFVWNAIGPAFGLFQVLHALFFLPFIGVGLFIAALGCYALWGRTTIDLTREQLSCRWSIGPLGFTQRLATPELESVRAEEDRRSSSGPRGRNRRVAGSGGSGPFTTCVARAGGKKMSLTFFNDAPLARRVASLVRDKLQEMGFRLANG